LNTRRAYGFDRVASSPLRKWHHGAVHVHDGILGRGTVGQGTFRRGHHPCPINLELGNSAAGIKNFQGRIDNCGVILMTDLDFPSLILYPRPECTYKRAITGRRASKGEGHVQPILGFLTAGRCILQRPKCRSQPYDRGNALDGFFFKDTCFS